MWGPHYPGWRTLNVRRPAGCSMDLSNDQITGYLVAYKVDPDN